MASPYDVCQLCGLTRENHGDSNHEFSIDGQLIPTKPRPEPRQDPPRERVTQEMKANTLAMLVEILAEKDILNAKDIVRIFSA